MVPLGSQVGNKKCPATSRKVEDPIRGILTLFFSGLGKGFLESNTGLLAQMSEEALSA